MCASRAGAERAETAVLQPAARLEVVARQRPPTPLCRDCAVGMTRRDRPRAAGRGSQLTPPGLVNRPGGWRGPGAQGPGMGPDSTFFPFPRISHESRYGRNPPGHSGGPLEGVPAHARPSGAATSTEQSHADAEPDDPALVTSALKGRPPVRASGGAASARPEIKPRVLRLP